MQTLGSLTPLALLVTLIGSAVWWARRRSRTCQAQVAG